MAVYATNPRTDIQGLIKDLNGQDYFVPEGATNFVISAINLTDIVWQSPFLVVTEDEQVFVDQAPPTEPTYLFRFIGYIEYSTDFPIPTAVGRGHTYIITNDSGVTDNTPSRTNTGMSFKKGDQVFWDGTAWSMDFGGSGSGGGTVTPPVLLTDTLVANTPKVVDTLGVTNFDLFEWMIIVKDSSAANRYGAKIFAINDDAAAVDFTEFAINEIGSITVNASVAASGGNMELTVESSVDATIKIVRQSV